MTPPAAEPPSITRRCLALVREGIVEQQPRFAPVALDRALRHRPELGDLDERVAAEEMQVDELRQRWLEGRQLVQRVGDLRELFDAAFIRVSREARAKRDRRCTSA